MGSHRPRLGLGPRLPGARQAADRPGEGGWPTLCGMGPCQRRRDQGLASQLPSQLLSLVRGQKMPPPEGRLPSGPCSEPQAELPFGEAPQKPVDAGLALTCLCARLVLRRLYRGQAARRGPQTPPPFSREAGSQAPQPLLARHSVPFPQGSTISVKAEGPGDTPAAAGPPPHPAEGLLKAVRGQTP